MVEILALLGILSIIGRFGLLGSIGKSYASLHFNLFGYLGYIWLLALAYLFYKNAHNLKERIIEKILGIVIIGLALLILQGLFIGNAGFFSNAFSSILKSFINPLGIFGLTLVLTLFGIVLYTGKSAKTLLSRFIQGLKDDLKKTPKDLEQPKKESFSLRLKAFFTLPTKISNKRNPHSLTLEELASLSKNPPSTPSATQTPQQELNFDNPILQTKEESPEESQNLAEQEESLTFLQNMPNIDGKSQNTPSSSVTEESQESQIRLISTQEAKTQKNHNLQQFQMESIMSLERFKNFEKNIFFQEEEDNDPIKLIKKTQDENLEPQETNPFAFLKDRQEPQESPAPNPKEDQSPQESLKESPKPIKAYPKKLYSATPFSAYYEKNPADATRDCLVPNDTETSQNQTTITNEDPIAEATPQNKPASIQQQLEDEDMRAIQMAIKEELQKAQDYLSVQQESSPNFVEDEIVQQETQEIIKEKLEEKKDIVLNSDYLTITNQQTTFEESPLQESPITSISQDLQEASLLQNINFPVYGYGNTFSQTPQETNPNFTQQTLPQQKPQENTPTPITPQSQQETLEILQNAIREKRDLTLQFKEEIAPTPTKIPLESNQNQPNQSIPDAQESITQVAPQTPQSQTNTTQVKILEENQNLLNEIETSTESKPIQTDFILPKLEFLQTPQEERIEIDEDEIDKKINDLLNKLRMFKIEGDIVRTYSGPIVTTFEFRPSPNVKVSRIQTLQDDLAMALRAKTIRIQAPVPGKDVVGIEIPNSQIQTIYLREILENDIFQNATSPLTLALGKDIVGNPFVTDLKKLPHLLIAGTTGSGKSVGINAMILSLLYKNSPDTLRLLMIDPKMLEFSIYNDIPHLLTPVITQPKKAIIALDNAVKEMERRYTLMSEARIKNIESYNKKAEIEGFEPFPYIVIVIDELADLMMSGGKEAELSIARLAQMARASGIHLIVATQRPSVDVVTGTIKANLPSRISYKVGQKIDSKVILDSFGAESLLGRGDMLFTPPGGGIVRLHAPWSTEEEIEKIVEFIKLQRPVQYNENFMPNEDETLGLNYEGETDELYEEAKRIMLANNKTSISYIQRRLGIGYNKAANIVEQMISRGFLSQPNSKGVREIIGE